MIRIFKTIWTDLKNANWARLLQELILAIVYTLLFGTATHFFGIEVVVVAGLSLLLANAKVNDKS